MNDEEIRVMWLERIEAYNAREGLAEEWCRENDIGLSALKYWRKKLQKENRLNITFSKSKKWLPVEVLKSSEKPQHNASNSGVSIHIGTASIEIAPGFDPKTLEVVIGVLSKNVK